ncbi:MAG TPA: hypothetical protein VGJ91_10185, partial [Polyangiaceae bacterium]
GWARGLSDERVANPHVQKVTENILARAGLFPEAPMPRPIVTSYESSIAARSRVVAGSGRPGHEDGKASNARFHAPSGIAVGPEGELYVCDTGNNQVRKISTDGQVSTVLGAGEIKLQTPTGIAVDASGNVYVSDTGTSRIIFMNKDGASVVYSGRAHVQDNTDDPDRGKARFNLQRGLTIDAAGMLYIADFRNDAIRKTDPSTGAVTTVVTSAGGPTAVAVGPDGTIYYVASWQGAIISVSPSGDRSVLANEKKIFGDRGGPGAEAALRPADGLIFTPDGLVFTDTGNNRVRALLLDAHKNVVTLLGTGRGGDHVGDGNTELCLPRSVAAVSDGYVVADTMNHRILHFSNDPGAVFRR